MALIKTFWHADVKRARRCIERETDIDARINRALQWDFGRMGVLTRFYVVETGVDGLARFVPGNCNYWDDCDSTGVYGAFTR